MKTKLKDSIKQVVNTLILYYQAYIYFNTYMVKSIFFGTAIFKLTAKQEEELKNIYEPVILKKLGLSKTFPRKLLYIKKTSISISLL